MKTVCSVGYIKYTEGLFLRPNTSHYTYINSDQVYHKTLCSGKTQVFIRIYFYEEGNNITNPESDMPCA